MDLVWYLLAQPAVPRHRRGAGRRAGRVAFAIGAFSIPYLLDRRSANLFEAIATSVAAVRLNPRPMVLWAALIVFLVVLGMVPGPDRPGRRRCRSSAYARWHAYRDIVRFEPAAAARSAGPDEAG